MSPKLRLPRRHGSAPPAGAAERTPAALEGLEPAAPDSDTADASGVTSAADAPAEGASPGPESRMGLEPAEPDAPSGPSGVQPAFEAGPGRAPSQTAPPDAVGILDMPEGAQVEGVLASGSDAGRPPESPPFVTLADGIARLAVYRRAVLSWVAGDGYPMNVDVEIEVKAAEGTVRFGEPPGFRIEAGTPVALTGSHIRPLAAGGFDDRSHITLWGLAAARPRARFAVSPSRVWAWDDGQMPLPVSYGRRLTQARRYYESLSAARGVPVRPRLSWSTAVLRAARAPVLRSTWAPILLGLAVAARTGVFDPVTGLLTLVVAGAALLALDITGGVFDLLHDPYRGRRAVVTSDGSPAPIRDAVARVRATPSSAIGCWALAAVLGLVVVVTRGSPALALLAVIGLVLVAASTTPRLDPARRGLAGPAAAIGLAPVLLLGVYAVQSRGPLSLEAAVLSLPLGFLAGMVVFLDEIASPAHDAGAGKTTVSARRPRSAVLRGCDVAAAGAFLSVAAGVATGQLPVPVLLALLAVPTAMRVRRDLARFYGRPNRLAGALAGSTRMQLDVGAFLVAGYLLAIGAQVFLGRTLFLP